MDTNLIGKRIAGLEIQELIGLGGAAEVYRAFDVQHDRQVAIKVLSQRADPDMIRRFVREGRVLLGLRHPHIVEVYDVGEAQMLRYIVMELMADGSLKERLQRGTPEWHEALRITGQVAQALHHAHNHGVVHRDVKPGNIMFAADGRAKLADFGLAGVADASDVTRIGTVLGTVFYLSPEQATGREVDGRTDLYALGAMLYEMLVGQPPFTGPSAVSIIYKQLNEEPRPLRQLDPSLPAALEKLVERLLRKRPEDRPQTAQEVMAALEGVAQAGGGSTSAGMVLAATTPDRAGGGAEDGAPFVGRQAEYTALCEALERALGGEAQVVSLSGAAGMGKTRLMTELALVARESNALVLTGDCVYDDAPNPYAPFVEVIRGLERGIALASGGDAEDDALRRHFDLVCGVLGIGGLHGRMGRDAWLEQAPPREAQAHLFESITQLVLLASRRRPLVIMLDDLQWASATTLQLVHYLARSIVGARVLLVGAYRPEDVLTDGDAAHPLRETLRRMSRERLYVEVGLSALSIADMEALIDGVLDGDEADPDTVMALCHESEGNPFYLLETLRLVYQDGGLPAAGVAPLDPAAAGVSMPGSVLDTIMRRIERTAGDDRELLDWAAVMGQRFDTGVLAPVVGQSRMVVLRRLHEIQRRHGLVHAESDGGYRFDHFKVWQALYEEIPLALRRECHGMVAHAYEDLCAGDVAPFVYDLARHYGRSGERSKAYQYSSMAADKAESAYALTEALTYLGQMLAMADEANVTPEGLLALQHRYGRLLLTVGRQEDAGKALDVALGLSREQGDLRREAEITLDLAIGCGRAARWGEAISLCDESRRLGAELGDEAIEANALLTSGFFSFEQGAWDDATERLDAALAHADKDDMLRARILGNAGILCDARGERHRAVELYRQSIDIARAHDQPRDLGRALNNMGYAHQRLSEHDEALRCYEEALVALDRAGDVREQGTAHLHMAEIGLALGDVAMAREHCVQATRRYSRLGFDLGIADVDRVYAGIARKEGRWRVAERYLREALVVYGEHGDQLNIAETHEELGRLLEEVGEAGQAEEELLQSRTLFDMLRGSDVADPAP